MPAHPLRFLAESKDASRDLRDAITGSALFWWSGVDLSLRIALSDYETFLLAAGVGTIAIEIKTHTADAADFNLFRAEFGSADCDNTFTAADWDGGGKALLTALVPKEAIPFAPGRYRLIVTHEKDGIANVYASTTVLIVASQSAYDGVQPPPQPGAWLDRYDIYPKLVLDHPPRSIDTIAITTSDPTPFSLPDLNGLIGETFIPAEDTFAGLPQFSTNGYGENDMFPRGDRLIISPAPGSTSLPCIWQLSGIDAGILYQGWQTTTPVNSPELGTWTNMDADGDLSITLTPATRGKLGQSAYFGSQQYVLTSEDPIIWQEMDTASVTDAVAALGASRISLAGILGTIGDSTLSYLDPTIGTDRTNAIQAILDRAIAHPIHLIWDGCYSVTGLVLHPGTMIEALPGCGAVLRPGSNTYIFANANWKGENDARDYGITIKGGIWNGNGAEQDREEGVDGMWPTVFRFANIEGLHISGHTLRAQPTFAVHLWNYHNVWIQDFEINHGVEFGLAPRSYTDGIHWHGGTNLFISRGVIATNDDALAGNPEDWSIVYGDHAFGGDCLNVYIEDIVVRDCHSVLRILGSHVRVDNLNIRNISGTAVRCFKADYIGENIANMAIKGCGNFGTIRLKNWSVQCSTTGLTKWGGISGVFDRIEMESINCGTSYSSEILTFDGDFDSMSLRGVAMASDIDPATNTPIGINSFGRIHSLEAADISYTNVREAAAGMLLLATAPGGDSEALGIRQMTGENLAATGCAHVCQLKGFTGDIRMGRIRNQRTFGSYGAIYNVGTGKLLDVASYSGSGPVRGGDAFTAEIGAALSTAVAVAPATDYSAISRYEVPIKIDGQAFAAQKFTGVAWTQSGGTWAGEYYGLKPSANGATLTVDAGKDGNFEVRSTVFFKTGGQVLIAIRYADANNWLGARVTASAVQLVEKVSGVETVIGAIDTADHTPIGSNYSSLRIILSVQGTGSSAKVYLNPAIGYLPTRAKTSGVANSGENEIRFISEAGDVLIGSTIISSL